MKIRIGILLVLACLLATELLPARATITSQANWWTYVIRREIGLDRLDHVVSGLRQRSGRPAAGR